MNLVSYLCFPSSVRWHHQTVLPCAPKYSTLPKESFLGLCCRSFWKPLCVTHILNDDRWQTRSKGDWTTRHEEASSRLPLAVLSNCMTLIERKAITTGRIFSYAEKCRIVQDGARDGHSRSHVLTMQVERKEGGKKCSCSCLIPFLHTEEWNMWAQNRAEQFIAMKSKLELVECKFQLQRLKFEKKKNVNTVAIWSAGSLYGVSDSVLQKCSRGVFISLFRETWKRGQATDLFALLL